MSSRNHEPLRFALRCLLPAIVLCGHGGILFGQTNEPQPQQTYTARMHTQLVFHPPPNEDKVKMQITGDLTNVASGALIINAELKNFSVMGGPPQLIAKTPSCIFVMSSSQISSTNILQAHSGDGNFYVEGVGFRWQKTEPDLTLS